MRWGRALAALVAVACAASSGCARCGGHEEEATGAMLALEAPLPAPEGLLADVYMGTPNASWGKLQRGIGGAVGILPATAGGIICTAAGLDPFIASELDGTAPMYGAIAGDPTNPGYVVAMKLLDLRKARGVLVDGDTARYSARDAGGMTELVAKGQGSGPPVVVAFSPNGYLLIAHRAADLEQLAPYVTRTLPKRPLPASGAVVFDVPRAAIGSLIKPKLEDLWATAKGFLLGADERMRRDHGGRAPDFGDPRAIVGAADTWITRRIAVVGDLEKMRVAVEVVDDGLSVVSTMTPRADGGPAAKWTDAMKLGDLAPLASLPASSAAALLLRDGEDDRADQAREIEKAVTSALGARLAEGDAKKLHDVMDDFTKARGEVFTTALAWDEPQGLSMRGPVRDADVASRAVRGAVDLAKVAPFKEIFRVRDVTTSSEELLGLGKASLSMIAREPARPLASRDGARDGGAPRMARETTDGGAPRAGRVARKDEVGLAWIVEGSVLSLATGDTPLSTLGATVRPERKLSDEPAFVRAFGALASDASSVLVVQPLRFDATRANLPTAPLLLALGRKDKDATLRIDIAYGLLRELSRWQLGL